MIMLCWILVSICLSLLCKYHIDKLEIGTSLHIIIDLFVYSVNL